MTGFKIAYDKKNRLATSKYGSRRDLKRLLGDDGIILSKHYQLNFKSSLEGILIIAPTRTGKTASLFMTNLLTNYLPKSSLVIPDLKGELYEKTSNYQKSIGRTPILYKPLGNNAKYNLLQQCRNETEIKKLAQNILANGDLAFRIDTNSKGGSSDWLSMAQPLLTACLLFTKLKGGTIKNAIEMILDNDDMSMSYILLKSSESVKTQYKLYLMALDSPKTSSSIKITLASCVQLFMDNTLNMSMLRTDFTAKDLREKPIALYISYEVDESDYLAPYLACFYTQFISHLKNIQGLPVLLLLDELGNLGKLGNFSNTAATCAGLGVGLICCLQSLTQLYQLYGRDNAMNILNNLKTKVVLPGLSDIEALRYVSNLCGNKEIMVNNYKTKKNLLDLDEVRRIEDDKAVIISQNKLPIIDDLNLYFKNEEYVKRSKLQEVI